MSITPDFYDDIFACPVTLLRLQADLQAQCEDEGEGVS